MTLLACGMCADGSLLSVFPFVFYWLIVFVLWGLGFGTWLAFARRGVRGPPVELPMNPLRHLLVAPAVIILAAPLTMGAVVVPLVPVLLVWVVRLGRSLRSPALPTAEPRRARLLSSYHSTQRVVFTAVVLLVPVAYARWYVQMRAIGML